MKIVRDPGRAIRTNEHESISELHYVISAWCDHIRLGYRVLMTIVRDGFTAFQDPEESLQ